MQVLASGLQFPEGPVAMQDGSVLLVELAGQCLTRVSADSVVERVAEIPGGPNGAAVGPDGNIYICNNGGGLRWVREGDTIRAAGMGKPEEYLGGSIDVVNMRTGRVERLYDRCGEHPLRSPNDLVFDAHGGFYFSDLGKRRDRDMDRGFVYWARADGSEIRQVAGPLITPNGVGLSPDGRVLYVAETETGRLWSYEIEAPGRLRHRPWPSFNGGRLVRGFAEFMRFDSLAVASSGNICVAALTDCSVMEIAPDGAHVRRHPVPDLGVTNLCFGGPSGRTAYLTLAHRGLLCSMDWHEPGLLLHHQLD